LCSVEEQKGLAYQLKGLSVPHFGDQWCTDWGTIATKLALKTLIARQTWAEPSPESLPLGAFMFGQGARHSENLYLIYNMNNIADYAN